MRVRMREDHSNEHEEGRRTQQREREREDCESVKKMEETARR